MKLVREWGSHRVYQHATGFETILQRIFGVSDLMTLQDTSVDYAAHLRGEIPDMQDIESDLHKKFYAAIKSSDEFKNAYCALIRDIQTEFFPNEPALIYQSFPSIRIQYVGNKAIPPHCDSDEVGRHPLGERNFLVPITRMQGTNRLFVESVPGAADYRGMDLEPGEILYFDGNKCIHYNETNQESYARISFDFRVLTLKDYWAYLMQGISQTNPRNTDREPVKIRVGGYYQALLCKSPETLLEWFAQKTPIMQTRPVFGEEEADACSRYFREGDPFLTEYKETERLEAAFSKIVGVPYVAMVPSGTSALMIAMHALGIRPGDEVIVPNYTMVATGNSVRFIGAIPVFVDVDPGTFTMHPEDVWTALTPRTRAVIHVTLNNRSCGLDALVAGCRERGIPLIEDAAQSLGCFLDGVHHGTRGDIGCFSLSSPKIITTGQGGFLVTRDPKLAESIRKLKNFGRRESGGEVYDGFGVNFKFTDIQAVIGLAQVSKLEERRIRLREMYDRYAESLKDCTMVRILPPANDEWIPWFVDVICEDRESLDHFLKQHGVQTRITYPLLDGSAYTPNASLISRKGLFLPTHFKLTDAEIQYIGRLICLWDAYRAQEVVLM